jgi:hypothetical protein
LESEELAESEAMIAESPTGEATEESGVAAADEQDEAGEPTGLVDADPENAKALEAEAEAQELATVEA